MISIDANIGDSPAVIKAVSAWLTDNVVLTAIDTEDAVRQQVIRIPEVWAGDASARAQARVEALGRRVNDLGAAAKAAAQMLDTLATVLAEVQAEMARALLTASNGGLETRGTVVVAPERVPVVAALPSAASTSELAVYQRDVAMHALAVRRAETWSEVVTIANGASERWQQALIDAARTWDQQGGNLVSLTNGLLSSGVEASAVVSVSRFAAAAAQVHTIEAEKLARHLDDLAPDGRVATSSSHWYDLYDRLRLESGLADDAAHGAMRARAPVALGRGLLVLGVAATGYGVYDDMQHGESGAQAAVSNGVGFGASLLAGAGAGAATGAIVGTFVPVPVVGTVAGVVVGTVVGTVAGVVTSGAIDSMWENGVESLGDVGDAVVDGWNELTGTVGDARDLVGDAAGAVSDTVKDAWDAFF